MPTGRNEPPIARSEPSSAGATPAGRDAAPASAHPESPGGGARPLIALTAGDPAGIGPEIARAALASAELRARARVVCIGPARECPADVALVASLDDVPADAEVGWIEVPAPEPWRVGAAQRASGRVALAALEVGARLAAEGRVDALVTAPVCKEALHLAGEAVEGQTELLTRWAGDPRTQMVGVSGALRVMLLTRHLPLADALREVTAERVLEHLELFDTSLRQLGLDAPHIALAGLNPHAGEGGILGAEEGRVLEPAVARARERGLVVTGPQPPDTVFLQASEGRFDGVLALYHDQAFIPLKLLSRGRGLTWIAGLPYLRLSPVHGTAFDIAGRGVASADNLLHALLTAAEWSGRRAIERGAAGESVGESAGPASAGAEAGANAGSPANPTSVANGREGGAPTSA